MRRRFLIEWLLMALLLPLAMLWLSERPGLAEADRAVYDALMRGDRRAAPSPDIVIVGIDERSIAALGPWPWSRTLHAQLLDQLAPHAPRGVLFNIFFDTAGAPEDDARLAAAMTKLPVYLPMDPAPPATPSSPALTPPRPGFFPPVPALARAAHGMGHVNAAADSDDRVRTLYRYEGTEERLAPYVGLLIASGAQDAAPAHPDFAPHAAWTRLSRFGFRLAGPAGSYRTVSYIDVLLGTVPPATFAGKTLLVGALADSRLNDQLAVTGTGAGAKGGGLPGVEVHANAIDVLMQGRAIEFPSATERWLWLALPIGAALAAFMLSARYAVVSALALALLMAGLGAVALREARVALPIATPLAGIAAAYMLWSWRRLAALLHFFRQRIDALNAVPSGAFEPAVAAAPSSLDAIEQRTRTLDRAIDRLVTLQAMLRQSVALMPAAVLVCRANGRIGQSNAAAQAMLTHPNRPRVDPQTQLAQDAADPLAERDLFALLAVLSRTDVATVPSEADLPSVWRDAVAGEYTTPAGDVFRLRAVPLRGEGSQVAPLWIVVLHALTAERRAQREREELFAFFSHDLRAPQVSILSLLALHADGDPATDTPALVRGVTQAVHRTLAMADGFMTMMEAESSAYRMAAVPLGAIALDAMDAVWADAQRRGVVLRTQLSEEAGCVMADGALLARALRNLLDNAIRHSRAGSEIQVCLAALPGADGRTHELLLSIRDEGEGMDAECLSRVREAGHRRTRSAAVPGWGIGLAVVNTVITRHGGWVEVSSRPGAGTTFLIGLPRCADEAGAEEA